LSRVHFLSGFATTTLAAEVLTRGAARYVEKGLDPDAIAAIIEEVADLAGPTGA
jgi:DNA-binding NarL/FixJ family response regulator